MADETNEGAWPDYTAPVETGQGEPAATPGGEGAETPAQPDGQAMNAGGAETGQDPEPQPGETSEEYFERFPKRRLAELVQQRNEAMATAQTLQRVFDAMVASGKMPGQPKPEVPAADPKQAQILDRLFAVVPGLKELVEAREQILAAAQYVPQAKQTNEQYWNAVAKHTVDTLFEGAAKTFIGADKTAKDLTPAQKARIHEDFSTWASQDRTRVQRYESLDQTLVQEFLADKRSAYGGPSPTRSAAAPAVARAKQVASLPRAGGSAPVATAKPKLDLKDEDAVHNAGWQALQAAIAAASR